MSVIFHPPNTFVVRAEDVCCVCWDYIYHCVTFITCIQVPAGFCFTIQHENISIDLDLILWATEVNNTLHQYCITYVP